MQFASSETALMWQESPAVKATEPHVPLSHRGSGLWIPGSELLLRFLVTCKSFYAFRMTK